MASISTHTAAIELAGASSPAGSTLQGIHMRYFQQATLSVKSRRGRPAGLGAVYIPTPAPASAGMPRFTPTHTLTLTEGGCSRKVTIGHFGDRIFMNACPSSFAPTQAYYDPSQKHLLLSGINLLAGRESSGSGSAHHDLRAVVEHAGLLVGDILYVQGTMPHIVISLPTGSNDTGKVFLSDSRDWDVATHALFSLDEWAAAQTYISQVQSCICPGARFSMELAAVTMLQPAAPARNAIHPAMPASSNATPLSAEQAALALAGMAGIPIPDCTGLPAQVGALLARKGWRVRNDGLLTSPEVGHQRFSVRFAYTTTETGTVIDCAGYLLCRKTLYPHDILCLHQSLIGPGQLKRFAQECLSMASPQKETTHVERLEPRTSGYTPRNCDTTRN